MSIAILSKKKKDTKEKQPKETMQETILSLIFTLALVLVFHTFIFSPFVIPSGSMAPTLQGKVYLTKCPECGYEFKSDSTFDRRRFREEPMVVCPMCHAPIMLSKSSPSAGDRLLVEKFMYNFVEPRRWDVIVFKNPQKTLTFGKEVYPGPVNDFIKRLVGLPNEDVQILDGNVYVKKHHKGLNSTMTSDADYHIARKSENEKAQRAMFVPIYHSKYVPNDGGNGVSRSVSNYRAKLVWQMPWVADEGKKWDIEGKREYTYSGDSESTIRFDFSRSHSFNVPSMYVYNQHKPMSRMHGIEDIRLGLTVIPSGKAVNVKLETTGRWDGKLTSTPRAILAGRIDAEGKATLTVSDPQNMGEVKTLVAGQVRKIDRKTELELWYADQQLILWRDGEKVLSAEYDLPLNELIKREAPEATPRVSITVDEPCVLKDVELDRDMYYASIPLKRLGRGTIARMPNGGVKNDGPVSLSDDQFFFVGDNSPWSNDSRFWHDVDPWTDKNFFDGQGVMGVVPREYIVGKALFCFYPSHKGWIPNFGDMRFIH